MANKIPDANGHNITVAEAKAMIKSRNSPLGSKKIDDSVTGVTFHKDVFAKLVNMKRCAGIRFYFAFASAGAVNGAHGNVGPDHLVPTLVAVGVDQDGKDILSSIDAAEAVEGPFENSWPYPTHGFNTTNLVESDATLLNASLNVSEP